MSHSWGRAGFFFLSSKGYKRFFLIFFSFLVRLLDILTFFFFCKSTEIQEFTSVYIAPENAQDDVSRFLTLR